MPRTFKANFERNDLRTVPPQGSTPFGFRLKLETASDVQDVQQDLSIAHEREAGRNTFRRDLL
jgi:hypothetical protein